MKFFKERLRNQLPPHIYAVARKTYNFVVNSKKSRAVSFTGRSGAGKTTQMKHFLNYLSSTVDSADKIVDGTYSLMSSV